MRNINKIIDIHLNNIKKISLTLKCEIYLGFIANSLRMLLNCGSTGFITSTTNKHNDLRTSFIHLLIVSPEC